MSITCVALSSCLLRQPGTDTAEGILCLNRLLWGGLFVTLLVNDQQDKPNLSELPQDHRLQQRTCQPHVLPSLEAALASNTAQHTPAGAASGLLVANTALPAAWDEPLKRLGWLVWRIEAGPRSTPAHRGNTLPCLASLPQAIAAYQQSASKGVVRLVAHVMAPKREAELAVLPPAQPGSYLGGLLCLVPQEGLVFAPLDLGVPLDAQAPFQALLHKASDELCLGPGGRPVYSPRIAALSAWLDAHHDVVVIDPLVNTAKVIDRVELCSLLSGVSIEVPELARLEVAFAGPAPHCIVTDAAPDAFAAVEAAGLRPPFIVKPAVACGLPGSHRMALVLAAGLLPAACAAAGLPLPLVVQEFRNHGGQVVKAYVAGSQVFHAVRPSIPNVPDAFMAKWAGVHVGDAGTGSACLEQSLASQGFTVFDSLKSLPTQPWVTGGEPQDPVQAAVSREALQAALEAVAVRLRDVLGLTLFGFDVVAVTCDGPRGVSLHVIDVNYLPNFRVPGAATHVWRVIADSLARHDNT